MGRTLPHTSAPLGNAHGVERFGRHGHHFEIGVDAACANEFDAKLRKLAGARHVLSLFAHDRCGIAQANGRFRMRQTSCNEACDGHGEVASHHEQAAIAIEKAGRV